MSLLYFSSHRGALEVLSLVYHKKMTVSAMLSVLARMQKKGGGRIQACIYICRTFCRFMRVLALAIILCDHAHFFRFAALFRDRSVIHRYLSPRINA